MRHGTSICTSSLLALTLTASASAQATFQRSFIGGGGFDRVQGVTVGPQGRIYIAGHTNSSGLPTTLPPQAGGFDTTWNGSNDAFVAILTPDLTQVLHWTLLGGTGDDRGYQVEIDPLGRVVLIGPCEEGGFPTTTGVPHDGGWDAFVARFSPDLATLEVCSLIGGSGDENPRGSFCIDPAGNVIIGGNTGSIDFPTTPGVIQPLHAPVQPDDWDAFVAKVSPAGQILWATFLGGSLNDAAHGGCRLAPDGTILVAGMTNSPDFPTTAGVVQPQFGGHGVEPDTYIGDGFVARLSADATQLLFSTFLGGSEVDAVAGNDALELDPVGNPVVIGMTRSPDFPVTPGAFDTDFGGAITTKSDAFVLKLSLDGTRILASTFLGGEQHEEPSGLAVGPGGEIFLGGNTESGNFPVTPDASTLQAPGGSRDAFIAKLSDDLRYLVYSTYVGGNGTTGRGDRTRGLTLLPSGDVLAGGDTDSWNFPVSVGAFDSSYNGGPADGWIDIEYLSRSYPFGSGKSNSLGREPRLRNVGAPSVASGGVTLSIVDAVPLKQGFFAYGRYLIAKPYQGGIRYMGLPVVRVPGAIALDAVGAASQFVPITPQMVGESRIYQFWYRDPAHPDGTRAGITNAVKVTFTP